MSADMYSTNPTLFGSALIAGTPIYLGYAPAAEAESMGFYVAVGVGIALICVALAVTGSVGGMGGMMRFCSTVGALACGFAAWRLWPLPYYYSLAIACAAAAPVLLLWGWGQAWWAGRTQSRVTSDE